MSHPHVCNPTSMVLHYTICLYLYFCDDNSEFKIAISHRPFSNQNSNTLSQWVACVCVEFYLCVILFMWFYFDFICAGENCWNRKGILWYREEAVHHFGCPRACWFCRQYDQWCGPRWHRYLGDIRTQRRVWNRLWT